VNPISPFGLVLPMTLENLMPGEEHGLETTGEWKVMRRWRLEPGYAIEGIHMHMTPTSQDTSSAGHTGGSNPHHSAQLRSRVDLSHGLEGRASAYFVDSLPGFSISSYTHVGGQLIWKWGEQGTFSFVGQDMQQDHQFEFQDYFQSVGANQAERSVYPVIRWGF
jgi:hypothetical protein